MEEDISDAIYGDLGDFEFNEKLQEQCQKIEDLTDQLNKSMLTITGLQNEMKDLKKNHQKLEKNSSSLLITARLEIKRKDQNIGQLQQKIDNTIFRRRNTFTAGTQSNTHAIVAPVFPNSNANQIADQISDQTQQQPIGDLSQFRIPKKTNPFAKNVIDNDHPNHITVSNGIANGYEHDDATKNPHARRHDPKDDKHKRQNYGEKDRRDHHITTASNGIENEHGHDEARRHSQKNNVQERRHDVEKEKHKKQTNEEKNKFNDRRDQYNKHEDKDRSKDRRNQEEARGNRRHSPTTHTSRRHLKHKAVRSDSKDLKRNSSRNNRKRSRGRSSSDEMDRPAKRRSHSSNRHRSKSRPSQIEEKVTKAKSPRKDNRKHGKNNRTDGVALKKDSIDGLLEKDLEVMLMAQTKLLNEMECTEAGQQPVQNVKSSKEHRKRKHPHSGGHAVKPANENGLKDSNHATNARLEVIDEAENAVEALPVDIAINVKNSDIVDANCEAIQMVSFNHVVSKENVLPLVVSSSPSNNIASENSSHELPLVELTVSTTYLCSPSKEVEAPSSTSIDKNVAGNDLSKDVMESETSKSIHPESDKEDVPKVTLSESTSEKDDVNDVPKKMSSPKSLEPTDRTSVGEESLNTVSTSSTSKPTSKKDVGQNVPTKVPSPTTLESMDRNSVGEERLETVSTSTSSEFSTSTSSESTSEKDVGKDEPTQVPSPTSPESIQENVAKDVSESAQHQNDESSNMDIDYELMARTPVESQAILHCKETDHRISVENQPPNQLSPTETHVETCNETNDESILSMKEAVHKGNGNNDSTLNSSQERHILSKSKEYTVEDAGYEIRIFLTKKRKKTKTKVTS